MGKEMEMEMEKKKEKKKEKEKHYRERLCKLIYRTPCPVVHYIVLITHLLS